MKRRGYTLIELLVASSVALAIVAVTVGVFLTQQRSFATLDLTRLAQDASRNSMMNIEPALRLLGLGVDPQYAIDMRTYRCTTANAGHCRDSKTGTDELVFVARNPNYQWRDLGVNGCATAGGCFVGNAWPITGTAAATVTITAAVGDQFVRGQVVQGVCANGSLATMGTVSTTTPTAPVTTAGSLQIPLDAFVSGDAYRRNGFTNACFSTAGAGLFLVNRYRYAIQDYTETVDKISVTTPWLVLDNGIDMNQNGTRPDEGDLDDLIPIAKGVEDMQVAYLYNSSSSYTAPDSNRDWIVGNEYNVVEEPDPTTAQVPTYTTPSTDASRFNLHPANVRGIRIEFSIQSLHPDHTQLATWTGMPMVLTENRTTQPSPLNYRLRYQAKTSVVLRNMDARSLALF